MSTTCNMDHEEAWGRISTKNTTIKTLRGALARNEDLSNVRSTLHHCIGEPIPEYVNKSGVIKPVNELVFIEFFIWGPVQAEAPWESMWNSKGKQHERGGKSDVCIGGNRASFA